MALRNITLSADAQLIDQARKVASKRNTTLNAAFREWLEHYTSKSQHQTAYDSLMHRFDGVYTDRPMNR